MTAPHKTPAGRLVVFFVHRVLLWIWSPVNLAALLLLSLACAVVDASPPAKEPSQADVEAVYLYDFGKFVRWPAVAGTGPMLICTTGSEPFSSGLQALVAGESIEGRSLAVRRVLHPGDTAGCAILFIDSTDRAREQELLASVADKPTLTVSDAPDFLAQGGMIQFVLDSHRVRFAVNLKPVARSDLSLSSELLKVAVSVIGAPEGGAQ